MNALFQKTENGTFAPADAAVVMAAGQELAQAELVRRGPELDGLDALKPLVTAFLAGRDHEFSCVAFLDARMRLIEFKVTGEGNQFMVDPNLREIVKAALNNGAMGVVMVHNHPGGVPSPSKQDEVLVAVQGVALKLFDIQLMDAWVTAGKELFSFRERAQKEMMAELPEEIRGLAKMLGIKVPKAEKDDDSISKFAKMLHITLHGDKEEDDE